MTQMPLPLTFDHSEQDTLYANIAIESSICKGNGENVETASEKPKRKTYPQVWPAYNAAQTHEQELFLYLLRELCDTIPQPPYTNGRPRLPLSDVLFSIGVKVFSTMSTRRVMPDMRDARRKALLDCVPSPTSIFKYMENADLTPHLLSLLLQSAAPLKAIEVEFAADASGFSSRVYVRWFDHKWGKNRQAAEWVKAHIITGVTTNVVCALEVTTGHVPDGPMLPQLLETTARTFDLHEVSADKAYLSKNNFHAIDAVGAAPYIPFKSNSVGHQGHHKYDPLWDYLWHYYSFNRATYRTTTTSGQTSRPPSRWSKRSSAEMCVLRVTMLRSTRSLLNSCAIISASSFSRSTS